MCVGSASHALRLPPEVFASTRLAIPCSVSVMSEWSCSALARRNRRSVLEDMRISGSSQVGRHATAYDDRRQSHPVRPGVRLRKWAPNDYLPLVSEMGMAPGRSAGSSRHPFLTLRRQCQSARSTGFEPLAQLRIRAYLAFIFASHADSSRRPQEARRSVRDQKLGRRGRGGRRPGPRAFTRELPATGLAVRRTRALPSGRYWVPVGLNVAWTRWLA